MVKIGFIGAGKIGVSLGKYFKENGLDVIGVYSRNEASAKVGAALIGVDHFETAEALISKSDILFLTVSDQAIKEVWETISKFDIKDKIICHCSGALSSCVFDGIGQLGAWGYSLHPAMAISHKEAHKELENAPFTLEGAAEKLDIVETLIGSLGNPVHHLTAENKPLYHCAAVFSSNFMTALTQISMDLLDKCGVDDPSIFIPLMSASAKNILGKGPVNALTGPVERGDVETVAKHLSALDSDEKKIYTSLSKKLIEIAEIKNPQRDYNDLKIMID